MNQSPITNHQSRHYFHRLYQHSKTLFWAVVIFCGMTLLLTFAGHQITPFFLWAMFSEKEHIRKTHEVIELKLNGETFNYTQELIDANRHIVTGSIFYYEKMKNNNDTDPTRTFFQEKLGNNYTKIQPTLERITNDKAQYAAFQAWLMRYLERSAHREIETLEVNIQTWTYDESGRLNLLETKPLLMVND